MNQLADSLLGLTNCTCEGAKFVKQRQGDLEKAGLLPGTRTFESLSPTVFVAAEHSYIRTYRLLRSVLKGLQTHQVLLWTASADSQDSDCRSRLKVLTEDSPPAGWRRRRLFWRVGQASGLRRFVMPALAAPVQPQSIKPKGFVLRLHKQGGQLSLEQQELPSGPTA